MSAEQNKNRALSVLQSRFCFVQVQGFWLKSAKNLALRIFGVCPKIQTDSQSMHLKRQNGSVLPSRRAETALLENAI